MCEHSSGEQIQIGVFWFSLETFVSRNLVFLVQQMLLVEEAQGFLSLSLLEFFSYLDISRVIFLKFFNIPFLAKGIWFLNLIN